MTRIETKRHLETLKIESTVRDAIEQCQRTERYSLADLVGMVACFYMSNYIGAFTISIVPAKERRKRDAT